MVVDPRHLGPTQATRPDAPPAPELGILFVHGIGEQKRGDTLMRFWEPLCSLFTDWIGRSDDGTAAQPFDFRDTDIARKPVNRGAPARTRIRWNSKCAVESLRGKEWVIAEAWWAESFLPGGFRDVARWSLWVGPWMFHRWACLHATRLPRTCRGLLTPTDPTDDEIAFWGPLGLVFWAVVSVLYFFAAFVAAFLLQVCMVVLFGLALLPATRRLVLKAQLRIANSVGDSYALASSPLRLSAMASEVERDLQWVVRQGCKNVAIVAHSQGTVVSHETLLALHQREHDRAREVVRLFVTAGSAFSKFHALPKLKASKLRLLAGSALSLVGTAAIVWALGEEALPDQRGNLGALDLISIFLASIVFYSASRSLAWIRVPLLEERDLLRGGLEDNATIEWHDFYAAADPVPDGPLPFPDEKRFSSKQIRTLNSFFLDHSSYLHNREEFLVPLARSFFRFGGLSDADQPVLPDSVASVDRRQHAVHLLSLARGVTFSAGLLAGIALLKHLESLGGHIGNGTLGHVSLFPHAATADVRYALGFLAVIAAATLWFELVQVTLWKSWAGSWDSRSREALYAVTTLVPPAALLVADGWTHDDRLWWLGFLVVIPLAIFCWQVGPRVWRALRRSRGEYAPVTVPP